MEIQKRKIEFYVVRSFGDKFTATFDFVSENWKPLLKYITYLLLPLCLFQGYFMNNTMGKMMGMADNAYSDSAYMAIGISYIVFALLMAVGSVVLFSIVYTLMKLYGERENRLQDLEWSEFRPAVLHGMKRMLVVVGVSLAFMLIVLAVIVLLAWFSGYTLIVTYPAYIAFAVPMALLPPIYLMEDDITIVDAVEKTFHLGFRTWGGIFAILLVIGIIAYMMVGIVSVPWGICLGVKSLLVTTTDASEEFTASAGYEFIMYLLSILQSFGIYVAYSVLVVAIGYQYGHAAEKIDGVSVEKDIDHFDEMADDNVDDFDKL
jgi:hypothetical protein